VKPLLFGNFWAAALLFAGAGKLLGEDLSSTQRLERKHLQAVHEARMEFARQRVALTNLSVYEDYRAVIHVHAEDSDHTGGTRAEVLTAARKAGVRVVMLTDHRGPKAETWHGMRDGVLFVAGAEEEGQLRFPNFDEARKAQPKGELRFLCHVEDRTNADTAGFDGMEICNRHTDAKLEPAMISYVRAAANDAARWSELTNSARAYPDECFGASTSHWPEIFAKWDQELRKHHFTGIAANDAHQNQVVAGVMFDPYEVSFRNLTTHILARDLTEPAIRQSLREGRAYVAHDWLCDPSGFNFGAANNLGLFDMGDTAPMVGGTRLVAQVPLPARLKVFHNGRVVRETNSSFLSLTVKEPGAYRLEAWLTVDGEARPWIYSNPVYLEETSTTALLAARLPSSEEPPNVALKKDIVYVEAKPEDEAKHKLDLYLPKDKTNAPVFVFIHGGAWRFGDRSLYPPLGYRLAREGIAVAVMSYRLAPKNPHPAQIEDVADAFAWVVHHIHRYGGDTNRIYVGGHSAGGHLAALLTLDESYLKARRLSRGNIRGVICLSGVYNVNDGSKESKIFGKDEAIKKAASPINHVGAPAPPFLVTYCQWDYPTLPLQARLFHRALRLAGVSSELIYVSGESHISEILSLTHENDPTAEAILKFIR